MRILLVNPPYQTFTSNLGAGHQVPLGLLMVGGALLDAGHCVQLVDAEALHLSDRQIVWAALAFGAEAVLTGHAGSTPAHPTCIRMLAAIKAEMPQVVTVYGGVYPTYHPRRILTEDSPVDFIVCGEGEESTVALIAAVERVVSNARPALSLGATLRQTLQGGEAALTVLRGVAYRHDGGVVVARASAPIADLDAYRVGWELVDDWGRYQCFGLGRSSIVQLSRGCPHACTYCGQHGFWVKWRHRDPVKLVDEIERLHREHGVRFVTLADENPTTLRSVWTAFLAELALRNLPVHLFATIRATDIVRDRELLPLWRKAGLLYILMGIESTDDEVIKQVKKGSCSRVDFQACRLLHENRIFSIIGHVVGLADETTAKFRTARRQLALYDGDYLNAMYVTPHTWTVFGGEMAQAEVIQADQSKWDYRHQILRQRHLTPLQLFMQVKWTEIAFHIRPFKVWRMLTSPRFARNQYIWTLTHTGRVFFAEVWEFFTRLHFERVPVTLANYAEPAAPESAAIRLESRPSHPSEPMLESDYWQPSRPNRVGHAPGG